MVKGVDPTSDRPVFQKIADVLRAEIAAGKPGPGERLGSETRLMERFDVSQGTVRHAIDVLRGEGIVRSEHGRGVFVRERPRLRRLAHDRFARRHRDAGKAAYLAEAETENAKPGVDVWYVGPEEVPSRECGPSGTGLRGTPKVTAWLAECDRSCPNHTFCGAPQRATRPGRITGRRPADDSYG